MCSNCAENCLGRNFVGKFLKNTIVSFFSFHVQIKYTQDRDAGVYECQVSTPTGTISRRVTLSVIYPEAFIQGGEEYHVDDGSPISLTCVIGNVIQLALS